MPGKKTLPSAQKLSSFRRRLLAWYAARKRDLPWRRTSDPYLIWISEIMLQQTRVAAVIPYYEKFIARFPTVEALANASPERVLSQWAGLGYYSRARNLHRAAKEIAGRHHGQFPNDLNAALELPGIGSYTAAAVLSIAYGQPLPVLDGNVARVLARLGAVRGELRATCKLETICSEGRRLACKPCARRLEPGDDGAWGNNLHTEIAELQRVPSGSGFCRARKMGIADRIPAPRSKRASVKVTLAAAVFVDPQGRTLLLRQTKNDGALFSRMWQFPALEITKNSARELRRYLETKTGTRVNGRLAPLATLRHTVTFREILLKPFLVPVASLPKVGGMRTAALDDLSTLPISNATRKIADAALSHLAHGSRG